MVSSVCFQFLLNPEYFDVQIANFLETLIEIVLMFYRFRFSASPRYLNQVHNVAMVPNQFWYCRLLAFTVLSSIQCSTYLVIAMTFECVYSIIRPHKAASFNTVKKAKTIIAFIYIFSFSYNIPYLFIASSNGKICINNTIASVNVYGELYYWLSEVISFILPFVSLLTMNSVIIHTLRQRSREKMSTTQYQSYGQNSKNRNSDKQIFTMLFLVTFGYLILTTHPKVLNFYLNFYSGNIPYYYTGLHLFYQIGEKTLYTYHGINFFLYVMSGQKFRTDFKKPIFIKKEHKK